MLKQLIDDLDLRIKNNEYITARVVITAIDDLNSDLREIIGWAVKNEICSAAEFKKTVSQVQRVRMLTEQLGAAPTSAFNFIELYAATKDATITADGQVRMIEDRKAVDVDEDRFRRIVRIASDMLDLRYAHASLDDAVNEYLTRARAARAEEIVRTLRYDPTASFDWSAIARATIAFDEDITADFAVANFQHFVWQIKRKQAGLPVVNHLMMIFGGAQDAGKSTFAKSMFAPLAELSRSASFSQITDDRIIDIWRSNVIFMDEMAFATRSDADEVKNVITADTLDRRPMRSNGLVKIRQQATMIGTTNQILAQVIRDTTGTRRFIYLPFTSRPDYAVINAANWTEAFRTVDETAASPILKFKHQLNQIQAASRLRSSVEQWIETITPRDAANFGRLATAGGVIRREDLFSEYRSYCATAEVSDRECLDLQGFANELKRLAQMSADSMFRPKKGRECNGFTYHGPVDEPFNLKVVR